MRAHPRTGPRRTPKVQTLLLSLAVAVCAGAGEAASADRERTLAIGEKIYREGLLPSGEPVRAIVQGDIPVDGSMFTCISCHLRSGLGSLEGTVVTLPTTGAKLYRPLTYADVWRRPGSSGTVRPVWESLRAPFGRGQLRPAYTDETLRVAMRVGKDPSGRKFDAAMPRYLLDDEAMDALLLYLKELSSVPSPGVTGNDLFVATVVTEGLPAPERQAMLEVLRAALDEHWGGPSGHHGGAAPRPGAGRGADPDDRRVRLLVWELRGPPEGWRAQLEGHYAAQPVFALVGGMAAGEWEPIHRFCEERGVPSLFPLTDSPVVADRDAYTVYFSRGLYQEGETAARFLRGSDLVPEGARVVQVFRAGTPGAAAARGFAETWARARRPAPEERVLAGATLPGGAFWDATAASRPEVLLLWLGAEDLAGAAALAGAEGGPRFFFGSSTLLGDRLSAMPEALRADGYLIYPHLLPAEEAAGITQLQAWLELRGLRLTSPRTQGKAYFAGWLLNCVLMEIRGEWYRDFLLDGVDMMPDQVEAAVNYPRLSFGPGQRYASKGCYVVQVGSGDAAELLPRSSWITY